MLLTLRHRFGKIADILNDALPNLSHDVVGLIARYAVHDTARPNSTLQHLFTFEIKDTAQHHCQRGCWCVAVAPDGHIWVGDHLGAQIFDNEGVFLSHAAHGHMDAAAIGIAFDTNGEVFLTCCRSHRVVVCMLDGRFIRTFGSNGRAPGQFYHPRGIVVDGKGLVFVADADNYRVQVCTRDGRFVRSFGGPPEGITDEFSFPRTSLPNSCGMVLDPKSGQLFVADYERGIQVFHHVDGELLRTIGKRKAQSITLDRNGNIFVVNREAQSTVVVFDETGTCIVELKCQPCDYCMAVAFDNYGRIILVDRQNGVHVFGLLHSEDS